MSQTAAQLINATTGTITTLTSTTVNSTNATISNSASIGTLNATTTTVANLNGGPISGFRNRLINPTFAIDQRNGGASVSSGISTVTYTVDRWYVYATGAAVAARQVSSSNTDLTNVLRITGAASTTNVIVGQRIEAQNSYDLAGKTVTLSFYASSSASITLGWSTYYANSSDNFTSKTSSNTGTLVTTPTLTRYSATFTLSSAATTGVAIEFTLGTLTSGTVDISGVQLELGTVATPLERRSYGHELALCQRYYWQGLPAVALNFPSYVSGSVGSWIVSFPVTMRVPPTQTNNTSGTTFTGCGSLSWDSANRNGGRFLLISTTISNNCYLAFGANDYLTAAAEL